MIFFTSFSSNKLTKICRLFCLEAYLKWEKEAKTNTASSMPRFQKNNVLDIHLKNQMGYRLERIS